MQAKAFLDSKPCIRVIDTDPAAGQEFHKLRAVKPVPDSLCLTASDLVNNLRSALDRCCYATAVASGLTNPKSTAFPFGDSADNLEGVIKRYSRDVPKDILTLIRSFKPYKGGNNLIWALNRICNVNKHALLVPMAASSGHMMIHHLAASGGCSIGLPWDRTKNEMVFASFRIGSKVDYNIEFKVFIAFDEVEPVIGQPADGILDAMLRETKRVLLAVKAESGRINLLP